LKTISDALRQAIRQSDQTLYRIAKDAEVDWGTLQRFLDGTRPNIRIDTVDQLCRHLGLTLASASARAARSRKR
jgi:DNA-binding Xre family transcriptional regulator